MHTTECRLVHVVIVKWWKWKLACRRTRPVRPRSCKKIKVSLFTLSLSMFNIR